VAPSFGVELTPLVVRDAGEIEPAVAAFARNPNDGCSHAQNLRRLAKLVPRPPPAFACVA
jgi:hypothetical protein